MPRRHSSGGVREYYGIHERPNVTFYAEIQTGHERIGLGTFETPNEVARWYGIVAWQLGHPRSMMNFHEVWTRQTFTEAQMAGRNAFIRNHLQEEQCFDTRNAVCPICTENLGKDMSAISDSNTPILSRLEKLFITSIRSLQRRKPSRHRCSPWPAAPGKEPYEETNPYMISRLRQDPEPDRLLSQFICGGGEQSEPESRDVASRDRPSHRFSQVELEEVQLVI
ncbi:hypothetical protein QYE76_044894 [Lolium multiflorum]|uniref:AP2/ERF domain-containing protein n=1 Tax=Lolium multiflorum TaxID=4521 RepID=A0AAD8WZA3_LOLMU|nr:hypothetical protein QYE76_044894 [Lolium multiflorum]